MKTGKIIKKPDYIGTLRRFSVGEAQTFKLVGLDYSSLRVAILRLNKREVDFQTLSAEIVKPEFCLIY